MTKLKREKNQLPYLIFLILALIGCGYVAYYFISFYVADSTPYNTSLKEIDPQIGQPEQIIESDIYEIEEISTEKDSLLPLKQTEGFDDYHEDIEEIEPETENIDTSPEVIIQYFTDQPPPSYNRMDAEPNSSSTIPSSPRPNNRIHLVNSSLPKICIIVTDFGNANSSLFDKFNALDKAVNFAFIPYQKNTQIQYERAISKNRNVFIQIKMETEDQKDKRDPDMILSTMNGFEIKDRIDKLITSYPQIIGVSSFRGKALVNQQILNTIFLTIKENNLFFLDTLPNTSLDIKQNARFISLKYLAPDLYLDVPDSSLKNAKTRIRYIQQIKDKELVIVVTSGTSDVKYRQLRSFIEGLKDAGYEIVSLPDAFTSMN